MLQGFPLGFEEFFCCFRYFGMRWLLQNPIGYSCLLRIFIIEGCRTKISIKKEAYTKRYGSFKIPMAWLFNFDDLRGSLDWGLNFCFFGCDSDQETPTEMMTCKVTINLNVLGSFMKNWVVSNFNCTFVVTIHRSRMRNKYFHTYK